MSGDESGRIEKVVRPNGSLVSRANQPELDTLGDERGHNLNCRSS